MPETLGQRVCLAIETFIVNHAMILIALACLAVIVGDFYARFFKINRDTDHVDLGRAYNDLQLRRRYKL